MDLAAKEAYLQKFARQILSKPEKEVENRPFVPYKGKQGSDAPKKKKKCKKKHFKEDNNKEKIPQKRPSSSPAGQKNQATAKQNGSKTNESLNRGKTKRPQGGALRQSFSPIDALRRKLHEKIEMSRGQGPPKDALSEEVQAKRAKRKQERERKKRKRKEFRQKKLAEQNDQQEPAVEIKQEEAAQAPPANKRNETAIVFNKVETVEQIYVDKMQQKKEKKQRVKGQVTPLVGKNYKQLLTRIEARKAKLEKLREKDEKKAEEMEMKMKWTNLLYKAEGIKIKDDEEMLRASLKKKEKKRSQRKKNWEERSQNVVEKMQQRQDKRRKNIQKQKRAKIEKKKNKARKKGRVMPEDLKKASV